MRIKGSLCVAIFFLLLGIFGIVQSLTFHYWESTVLPLLTSSLIFVLAAVEIGKELRQQDKKEAAAEEESGKKSKNMIEMKMLGWAFGWVAGFSLGIYLFGFYIAIPLFAFAYLKWRGRSWFIAIVFAFAMLAFVYGLFELGLKVPLFEGLIFGGR